MLPKFSVVIATYNREKYLLETIQSVVSQTYTPYEIIVVSDGSTDGTVEAVKTAYPGVILIEQPNLGRSVARNTGVATATGDWICLLDDDDLWHQSKLTRLSEYITAHPDCKALEHQLWFFSQGESGPKHAYGFERHFVADSLEMCHTAAATLEAEHNHKVGCEVTTLGFEQQLERNHIGLSCAAVERRTLIRAGAFCPMQTYGEEWTLFLNIARLCDWHKIADRLTFYRMHDAQSSGPLSLYILAGFVNAWYTGRPMPHSVDYKEMLTELKRYGPIYRTQVQSFYWTALRSKQFGLAHSIKKLGALILPNRTDWLYAMTPPQITWRWEKHVRGKHKSVDAG